MSDETELVTATLSKDELLAEMKVATDAGDWKAVSKISAKIAKAVATEEKTEKDAKLAKLTGLTEEVRKAIDKAVKPFMFVSDAKQPIPLEFADGIWYSYDFADTSSSCKLIKGTTRKSSGGGGKGKSFAISTVDLLAKHGSELMGDSGMTFQEAYDANPDGNSRYKVRMKLIKAEGLS